MKRFFILILMIVTLSGCALWSHPEAAYKKAQAKVEKVETRIETNNIAIINEAAKYAYAEKLVLDKDTNSPLEFHKLELDFSSKTIALLGQPDIKSIDYLTDMINNLLATNQTIQLRGQEQEKRLDGEVIILQNKNTELQGLLQKAEEKFSKVNASNALLADKWATVMRYVWIIVYGFIVVFVVRIISAALPAPYNSIAAVISLPITFVVSAIKKLVPEAISGAKLVGSEFETATTHLVQSIQQVKQENPAVHASISNIVNNTTNEQSTAAINQIKTKLNITS